MINTIKKTSAEWIKISDWIIVEPSGWNRKNFDYFFHQEKISLEEFNERMSKSKITKKPKSERKTT
jgi:hypothetical protein